LRCCLITDHRLIGAAMCSASEVAPCIPHHWKDLGDHIFKRSSIFYGSMSDLGSGGTVAPTFRAEMWDQIYFFLRHLNDLKGQIVLQLDGRLDEQRLQRAARLTLDAHPILGCRFVERGWSPRWERMDDPDGGDHFHMSTRTHGDDEYPDAIFHQGLKPNEGPQLQVLVLRGKTDEVCVLMNHMVGDAHSVVSCANTLARIYRRLGEDPDFRPVPIIENRAAGQVLNELDLPTRMRLWGHNPFKPRGNRAWRLPMDLGDEDHPFGMVRTFKSGRLDAVRDFGKSRGATVNDVILAAYFRAVHRVVGEDGRQNKRILVNTGMRQYLKRTPAAEIANLSDFVYCSIGKDIGSGLDGTLALVKEEMDRQKNAYPGLHGLAFREIVFSLAPYSLLKAKVMKMAPPQKGHDRKNVGLPPSLSNLGVLDGRCPDFGDVGVMNFYQPGPVNFPPSLQMAVSTFRDRLTLCSNSLESKAGGRNRSIINDIYDNMEEELPD